MPNNITLAEIAYALDTLADVMVSDVTDELAGYLKVNVTAIYLWSQRGQIPAMKVGNLWRYRRVNFRASVYHLFRDCVIDV
jgi:excisionase family DNA binding protein